MVQGGKGKVQDMVVQWIAVGWKQVGMGVACHAMAALGLGFRVWGVWGVSRGVRGYWVRCWTSWFGKWVSG